jgi:flagellin-specific chaperone FliS
MKSRLFKANVEQSVNPLSETESLLENLSSAWKQLVNETHDGKIKRRNHAASKLRVLDAETSPTIRLKSLNISG